MASRRLEITAPTGDAIATEEIRRVDTPSIVNFWAAGETVSDEVGVFLNRTELLPADRVNMVGDATQLAIDTDRDQLLFNTRVGRGQLRVPVPALTTALRFLLSVEPILG